MSVTIPQSRILFLFLLVIVFDSSVTVVALETDFNQKNKSGNASDGGLNFKKGVTLSTRKSRLTGTKDFAGNIFLNVVVRLEVKS